MKLNIDGRVIEAESSETILSVARRVGIHIPTLCYLDGKGSLESCGVCMVEVEGQRALVPACAYRVSDGIIVRTDSPEIRSVRKRAVELLLSEHLGDCEAPCEIACPAHVNIPRFVKLISEGRRNEALETIYQSIAFPGVLARICPAPCETACRRGKFDQPVSILHLERYASDLGKVPLPERKPESGKRVAIIGAGMAGLTSAFFLLSEGHRCTIFDSARKPGGNLRLIPSFRLPQEIVEREIALIEDMKAEFQLSAVIRDRTDLEELRKDYDAVLIAVGVEEEESELRKALPASELLERVAEGEEASVPSTCLVAGAGPASIDTARTLLRLGSKEVKVVLSEVPLILRRQIETAIDEGVRVLQNAEVEEVTAVAGSKLLISLNDGSQHTVERRGFFFAGKLRARREILGAFGLAIRNDGALAERTAASTKLDDVFCVGAVMRPGMLAVQVSASALRVARSVSACLKGEGLGSRRPVRVRMRLADEDKKKLLSYASVSGRIEPPKLAQSNSIGGFDEVLKTYPKHSASEEARRCLQCACLKNNECELRKIATELGADPSAFDGEKAPFDRDLSHPDIIYEPGKCIRCGRCVLIAQEAGEELGLAFTGRGFEVRVAVPFNKPLAEGLRKSALKCADACPTGALARRR